MRKRVSLRVRDTRSQCAYIEGGEPMKIIKRNGAEVPFDITKIITAVTKASDSVGGQDRLTREQITQIAAAVTDQCQQLNRAVSVEEVQDLVATFYSTGDYISENASEYASMLTKEDEKDEFYYCLYLLSMLSSTNELLKVVEHIVKSLNSSRVRRKVTSIEEFQGEIDIEAYIARNYVEKVSPKEYPSVIKCSTFQMPEYQLTLYIIRRVEEIYHSIFKILGDNKKVTAFKMAHRDCYRIKKNGLLLRRKYGVDYKRNETYLSLKKKVIYRYRNRKILNKDFKFLIQLFEKMIQLKGIDLSSSEALDVLEHSGI